MEGNNHTISNLFVKRATAGLFGELTSHSEIRNLGLGGGLAISSGGDAGFLAVRNRGKITLSYATGDVSAYSNDNVHSGGLVVFNYGEISASYATGDVSSYSDSSFSSSGGLVGDNNTNKGIISFSYATGNISSSTSGNHKASLSGGLVGANLNRSTITSSYAMGSISVFSQDLDWGGILGVNVPSSRNRPIATITFSYWNTDATQIVNGSTNYPQRALSRYADIGSVTGLTQTQFKAISGTYPNELTGDLWDLGTASQYPGLVIGNCIHRPTGTASRGFTVVPVCTNLD